MKLDAARAIIAGAPNTHLANAARTVLGLLDSCDLARVEAAEAHMRVQAEALAVAREEAQVLDQQVQREKARGDSNFRALTQQTSLLAKVIEERDRLAKELDEARLPDPDLPRLRALEQAAVQVRDARAPLRVEGRAAYDYIVRHLTPHLV